MEGYLHLRIAPWLRRLVTRLIALVPAVLVICAGGRGVDAATPGPEPGDSQPAALVRGDPADPFHLEPAEHGSVRHALVGPGAGLDRGGDHRRAQRQAGARPDRRLGELAADETGAMVGPIPLAGWWPAVCMVSTGGAVLLLVWVTIKPWFVRRRRGCRQPSVQLDWVEALRPRPLAHDRRRPGTQPGRRRDPQPRPRPGPDAARASWSCCTWSTRR